ncbi:hypothetical protein B6D60_06900 [candidate division KSB1 bacterium 4484_87]|nr:MAG: hypothetical protein B6D60_06900 [candidate division KSB1 bacterium 4484_87]
MNEINNHQKPPSCLHYNSLQNLCKRDLNRFCFFAIHIPIRNFLANAGQLLKDILVIFGKSFAYCTFSAGRLVPIFSELAGILFPAAKTPA